MRRAISAICFIALILASPCFAALRVAATIYPLEHFAQMAGGGNIETIHLMPQGVDPHSFEPSPRDMIAARKAQVLLMNGGGFDAWALRIADEINKSGVLLVDFFTLLSTAKNDNPHIWLDPLMAIEEVRIMRDAFIALDTANENAYRASSERYMESLRLLHSRFKAGLENCERRAVVVSHDAFSPLAKRYGIRLISIKGRSTEEEPSLKQIANIVEEARREGIKHVFAESMGEQRLARAVADELNAGLLVLHSIEGVPTGKAAMGYIELMDENLLAMRKALGCR